MNRTCFCEDLALFGDDLDLATEPPEFLALARGQAIGAAYGIEVSALAHWARAFLEAPNSLATSRWVLPDERISSTARVRDSSEYGGRVRGM